ncbi:hypothetical protein Tco_0007165 [Tanacetum coccineum]
MASLDYRSNLLFTFKECSSCGALYNKTCACSKGGFVGKFVRDPNKTPDSSQRPPHNCPNCGDPVDGLYCRQCALLRKKLREIFDENEFFQDLLNPSESSNDKTNVVNLPQEPFVFNQDPGENSSQSPPHIDHHCCYECGDSLDDIFCQRCTCKSCGNGAHYGYNCPPKVPIISNPEPCNNQTIDELPQTLPSFDPTCYSGDGNSFTYDSTPNFVNDSPNIFNPPPQPQYVSYSCELCGNDAHHDCGGPRETFQCQLMNYYEPNPCYDSNYSSFDQFQPPQYIVNHPIFNAQNELLNSQNDIMEQMKYICDMIGQYMQKNEEEKRIAEEQAAKNRYWKIPICYDDDDDEENSIPWRDIIIFGLPPCVAITPVLSTEEPVDSLIIEDEQLDTIPATESDEVIKSSVEDLVPIPSESEGIPDKMCDVPFRDNSLPLDISKDQFEGFFDSNDDSTSIDDDSFSIGDIDYVDTSPPNSELVSLEDSMTIKLKRRVWSEFYHKAFVDELAHIISPPEYDCCYFKNEPDPGELTSIVDSRIHENVLSMINVNLPFEDDQSPLLAEVLYKIFHPFHTYGYVTKRTKTKQNGQNPAQEWKEHEKPKSKAYSSLMSQPPCWQSPALSLVEDAWHMIQRFKGLDFGNGYPTKGRKTKPETTKPSTEWKSEKKSKSTEVKVKVKDKTEDVNEEILNGSTRTHLMGRVSPLKYYMKT